VVAGGVGANRRLRERLDRAVAEQGCSVFYPEFEFCTDNGAMIALAGALRLGAGFVLFQAAWFACVIGAARGQVTAGIVAVAVVVAILVAWSARPGADLRLVVLAVATGVVWDSLLALTGVIEYASPGPLPGVAPLWILALWALLAPMLREPMRWLHGRPIPAALLGAAGGVLSYAAAQRLGACAFPDPALAVFVLGAGWALIVPLLLAAAQRVELAASPRRSPAAREVGA